MVGKNGLRTSQKYELFPAGWIKSAPVCEKSVPIGFRIPTVKSSKGNSFHRKPDKTKQQASLYFAEAFHCLIMKTPNGCGERRFSYCLPMVS